MANPEESTTTASTIQVLEALVRGQQQLQQSQLEFQQAFLQMLAQTTRCQSTSPSVDHSTASHAPAMRTAPPDIYDGTYDKFGAFITQLEINFSAYPSSFPSDRAKINYAMSFMKGGRAQQWVIHLQSRERKGGACEEFASWESFATALKTRFSDPQKTLRAQNKLMNLKQRKNQSVNNYLAEFELLAADSQFNDQAILHAFKNGLHSHIYTQCVQKADLEDTGPKALMAWKEYARWADSHTRVNARPNTQSHNRPFAPRTPLPSLSQSPFPPATVPTTPTGSRPRPNNGEPMDLDRTTHHTMPRKPLICYHCNQPGHIRRHCPSSITEQMQTMWTSLDEEGRRLACQALGLAEPEPKHSETPDQPQEGF